MFLEKLSVLNFKNYQNVDVQFGPKLNCLVGKNGVGKTNILDAVYYLSFCKSFLNPIDSHNVKHEEKFFMIHGEYCVDEGVESYYCGLKKGDKKVFKKGSKPYEKFSEHIGQIPLVICSPYDAELVLGGSEVRRKFLDGVISQFNNDYLNCLLAYKKALQQRNKLLKSPEAYTDTSSIEVWDTQLVKYGSVLHLEREKFTNVFVPYFQRAFEALTNGKEELSVELRSQLHESEFTLLLESSLQKDLIVKYTTVGPHRDELDFKMNGHPLKKIGSQGQQKSLTVALKLALHEYMDSNMKRKPILLLDDIFDKLDSDRVSRLLHIVSGTGFGQVFITDTNHSRLKNALREVGEEINFFEVCDGNINVCSEVEISL